MPPVMKNAQSKWWHKDYILPMHVEQSKLSLNVPRKAAEECWQPLLDSGDLEASILFFFLLKGCFLLSSLQQLKGVRLALDFYEHV